MGTYFSEEIKYAISLGYKFNVIKALSFTKESIFNDYVEHFYEKKKMATGGERFIAKLHLNSLYGILARKKETLKSITIHNDDLAQYLPIYNIKSIIDLDENHSTLLIEGDYNRDNVINMNITIEREGFRRGNNPEDSENLVESNVAISAAVTAYARIHMAQFKNNPDIEIYYTDTDSIFIKGSLPDNLVSDKIGFMKDELEGEVIQDAVFIGIKNYGFKYFHNSELIEKSVWAGFTRDAIPFSDLIKLNEGASIERTLPSRFTKNLNNLSIIINNNVSFTLKANANKQLINNEFIPIILNSSALHNKSA